MESSKKYELAILIEDNDINSLVAQRILLNSGFFNRSIILPSGFSALEYLNTTKDHSVETVIFLDIKMPQLNGFQFLEEFEKISTEIRQHYTLIILSGNQYEEALQPWKLKKIVNGSIVKPLNSLKLTEVLNSVHME